MECCAVQFQSRCSQWRATCHRGVPTDNGPADYALCVDGRIVGIVEAKKLTLGPQNVLTQAERYSRGATDNPFNFDGRHVPFLYSTNGEVIWHHDIRRPLNRSRRIAHFHTPDALTERLSLGAEEALQQLAALPNDHPRLRPYQIDANTGIEQAIEERKRQMLVAMATGTGKTFTMVNQCYRLMKSGVAKRILFLVDRRALAAQAVRSFASFEAEPGLKFDKIYEVYSQRFQREDFDEDEKFDINVLPNSYLTKPSPAHVFVYVCTIQRMTVNLFGLGRALNPLEESLDDAAQLEIPNHAFDVIIADECHRGYTAQEAAIWRNTLDHFDAIKIGLTATPAAHTTSYFKHVVYRYEFERAVREGYLVDYDVVALHSNVRMNGVFLDEGDEVSIVDPDSGAEQLDLLEDERQFDATEVEQKVTAPDSNLKILEEIRTYATRHEQECGRFPKTLIFAVNDLPHTGHADQLVDIARDVFGRGDAFVQKITGRVIGHCRGSVSFATGSRSASLSPWTCFPPVWTFPTSSSSSFARSQIPHPVRADARPGHAQGRAFSGQIPLRRVRLLRWHADGVFPGGHRHHGGTGQDAFAYDQGDHRRYLAEPGPGLQRSCPGQAATAY